MYLCAVLYAKFVEYLYTYVAGRVRAGGRRCLIFSCSGAPSSSSCPSPVCVAVVCVFVKNRVHRRGIACLWQGVHSIKRMWCCFERCTKPRHPWQRPTVPPLQSLHVNSYICTMTRNGCAALDISGDLWGDVYIFSAPVPSLGATDWIFHLARSVCLSSALLACLACSCLYASPSPCLHLRRAPAHCRTYASLPTALWLSNAIYCIRFCRCGCVTACCTVLACVRLDRVGGWGPGESRNTPIRHRVQADVLCVALAKLLPEGCPHKAELLQLLSKLPSEGASLLLPRCPLGDTAALRWCACELPLHGPPRSVGETHGVRSDSKHGSRGERCVTRKTLRRLLRIDNEEKELTCSRGEGRACAADLLASCLFASAMVASASPLYRESTAQAV